MGLADLLHSFIKRLGIFFRKFNVRSSI
uniref:HUA2 n=1 Tax=Arundo donax TaxID=35708 RepID=A0A0A9DK56_ARUDO